MIEDYNSGRARAILTTTSESGSFRMTNSPFVLGFRRLLVLLGAVAILSLPQLAAAQDQPVGTSTSPDLTTAVTVKVGRLRDLLSKQPGYRWQLNEFRRQARAILGPEGGQQALTLWQDLQQVSILIPANPRDPEASVLFVVSFGQQGKAKTLVGLLQHQGVREVTAQTRLELKPPPLPPEENIRGFLHEMERRKEPFSVALLDEKTVVSGSPWMLQRVLRHGLSLPTEWRPLVLRNRPEDAELVAVAVFNQEARRAIRRLGFAEHFLAPLEQLSRQVRSLKLSWTISPKMTFEIQAQAEKEAFVPAIQQNLNGLLWSVKPLWPSVPDLVIREIPSGYHQVSVELLQLAGKLLQGAEITTEGQTVTLAAREVVTQEEVLEVAEHCWVVGRDVFGGQEASTTIDHRFRVTSVAWSPDGRTILSGSGELGDKFRGELKLWEANTGQEKLTFQGSPDSQETIRYVLGVAWSPDGQRVVSTHFGGLCRIWNVATGKNTLTLRGHRGQPHCVAWSPDGKRIITGVNVDDFETGVRRGEIRNWNAATGRSHLSLDVPDRGILCVAFSPDGQRFAAGTTAILDRSGPPGTGRKVLSGGQVKVWNTSTGTSQLTLEEHQDALVDISFSPDGQQIFSIERNCKMRVWNAQTGKLSRTVALPKVALERAVWSPDASKLLLACANLRDFQVLRGQLRILDLSTGDQQQLIQLSVGKVLGVAWSPDGRRVTSGCERFNYFFGSPLYYDLFGGRSLVVTGQVQIWNVVEPADPTSGGGGP